jgi:hypothetical protein
MPQTAGAERRAQHKERYWKDEESFSGAGSGWFKAPRTTPLILALLTEKRLTEGRDVSRVYLELLSRHMDGGLIELGSESEHAYAAGYTGARAIRTWQERMRLLERLGFIKTMPIGGQRYKLVLLVDPLVAVAALYRRGEVPPEWWEAYRLRVLETREADEVRLYNLTDGYEHPPNVIPPPRQASL